MIEKKDIEKLAALARITIPENEIEEVRGNIEVILAYVGQINEANVLAGKNAGVGADVGSGEKFSTEYGHHSGVKNVMREDSKPHESGKFTPVLLKSAPKTEKGFIKVKKILQ